MPNTDTVSKIEHLIERAIDEAMSSFEYLEGRMGERPFMAERAKPATQLKAYLARRAQPYGLWAYWKSKVDSIEARIGHVAPETRLKYGVSLEQVEEAAYRATLKYIRDMNTEWTDAAAKDPEVPQPPWVRQPSPDGGMLWPSPMTPAPTSDTDDPLLRPLRPLRPPRPPL